MEKEMEKEMKKLLLNITEKMGELENLYEELVNLLKEEEEEETELVRKMRNLLEKRTKEGTRDKQKNYDIEMLAADYLHKVGVPAHIKGYQYLKDAIIMVVDDEGLLHKKVTKILYPQIAKRHQTTPSRVERAIRHAIETSCFCYDPDLMEKIFGNTISEEKGKPTNSEFIGIIVDYIKMEMKMI